MPKKKKKFDFELVLCKRNALGEPLAGVVTLASNNPRAIAGFYNKHRKVNPKPKAKV